jgi:hypothetical protein
VPPDEPVFFVDRCLGARTVPDALRVAGARVEVHADHFADDAPDPEILRFPIRSPISTSLRCSRWTLKSPDYLACGLDGARGLTPAWLCGLMCAAHGGP